MTRPRCRVDRRIAAQALLHFTDRAASRAPGRSRSVGPRRSAEHGRTTAESQLPRRWRSQVAGLSASNVSNFAIKSKSRAGCPVWPVIVSDLPSPTILRRDVRESCIRYPLQSMKVTSPSSITMVSC